jgi:TolA-binding protein
MMMTKAQSMGDLLPATRARVTPARRFNRMMLSGMILFLAAATPAQIMAQTAEAVSLRVGKLEKEMKAVQRKVFPTGVPVEPEIGGTTLGTPEGSPANSAVVDLTARVDALESQLRSLTGQVEQNGFRLKKLEDGAKAQETRLKALEPAAEAVDTPSPAVSTPAALTPKPVVTTPKPVATAPVAAVTTPKPAAVTTTPAPKPTVKAATTTDPKRKALVDAVPIPVTNDPIEDSYTYGFRLWTAKLYPEAQRHLRDFSDKYPKHKRASFARNLLGRSYYDDKLYNAAAKAFLGNYQADAKGERAAESLSWLGLSLIRLNQMANACKVYKEFGDVYGATAAADVVARVTKGRAEAKCAA